ncbi:hypothetical protein BOTBODRAFT_164098 [Botryobasidium botryosum FD-172 SS1]|uniref:Uncharacterized protein n=1 Tax=Botryobasidium botryosum (strain FD-172 SS1) TaxID=930990 RepID=A0A067M3K9_BOTB1|nr:hypothetical protein BOTBODRAFT_164098 [Botryobasidium botryosum FD-172 SS1]
MSSRLASFRGPSSPSPNPVRARQQQQQPHTPRSPSSPSTGHAAAESPFHRKLRSLLLELRAAACTWDDLVLVDGAKAAKSLVDTRTELDNALALLPSGTQPTARIVGPKLDAMEVRTAQLRAVLSKLEKQFTKMASLVDSAELILTEASKAKGWQWVHGEPLWCTWSLEKFVTSLPALLPPYHRSLHLHKDLFEELRDYDSPFEASRAALSHWVGQPWLAEDGWTCAWEDLCAVEVDRWEYAR